MTYSEVPELRHLEKARPALFGKFGLMGMEHVHARFMILAIELQDTSLTLALHYRVDGFGRWLERGSMIVVVEEIGVQVK